MHPAALRLCRLLHLMRALRMLGPPRALRLLPLAQPLLGQPLSS